MFVNLRLHDLRDGPKREVTKIMVEALFHLSLCFLAVYWILHLTPLICKQRAAALAAQRPRAPALDPRREGTPEPGALPETRARREARAHRRGAAVPPLALQGARRPRPGWSV